MEWFNFSIIIIFSGIFIVILRLLCDKIEVLEKTVNDLMNRHNIEIEKMEPFRNSRGLFTRRRGEDK